MTIVMGVDNRERGGGDNDNSILLPLIWICKNIKLKLELVTSPSKQTQLDTHIWTQCRSLKAGLALTVGLNLTYSLSLCISSKLQRRKLLSI
jgi:hypothetical protein